MHVRIEMLLSVHFAHVGYHPLLRCHVLLFPYHCLVLDPQGLYLLHDLRHVVGVNSQ